jgi:hypothetical protein
MLARIRGVTLEMHKLALSMQRLNPELLAGEAGISEAYGIIGKALEATARGDGLANRRLAAKHLDKLRDRAEAYTKQEAQDLPLEPIEEIEISAELMALVAADAAPTNVVPFTGQWADATAAPEEEQSAPEAPPAEKKPRAPKKPKDSEPAKPLVPDLPDEDDVDFDSLVKGNTTVQKDDDHE